MSEVPSSMLDQIKDDLTKAGVEVDKLGVVMVGNEQIYGEIIDVKMEPMHSVRVRNPKRMLRLQQVQPGNFRVDFIVIDLDLITHGTVVLFPQGIYFLSELDADSQGRMMALYVNYFENKKRANAAAAGIVVPDVKPPANVRPLK
jgi:hypothetical protein